MKSGAVQLEIAGLLHDIGRLGMPDDVLFAHENLSPQQEAVLNSNRQMGVDLVETTFACPHLTEIVSLYRTLFADSNPYDSSSPSLPVGARILMIVDAFDELTHPRDQSKSLSEAEAIEMLRAEAGERFDPELIERFVYVVESKNSINQEKVLNVPKDAAISIGVQMEGLAAALDSRDSKNIVEIASCLHKTTLRYGVDGIANKAAEIAQMAVSESDLFEVVQIANELLDLCRLSQRSLLNIEPRQRVTI